MKQLFLLALASLSTAGFADVQIKPFGFPWVNYPKAGVQFQSKDYPNGIFVLHLYFNGCPINHEYEPTVNKITSDYSTTGRVHVLDVGIDVDDGDYKTWIDDVKPNHPVLKDSSRVVSTETGVTAYPCTFVSDCKGNVHYQLVGIPNSDEEVQLRKAIDDLLQSDCTP